MAGSSFSASECLVPKINRAAELDLSDFRIKKIPKLISEMAETVHKPSPVKKKRRDTFENMSALSSLSDAESNNMHTSRGNPMVDAEKDDGKGKTEKTMRKKVCRKVCYGKRTMGTMESSSSDSEGGALNPLTYLARRKKNTRIVNTCIEDIFVSSRHASEVSENAEEPGCTAEVSSDEQPSLGENGRVTRISAAQEIRRTSNDSTNTSPLNEPNEVEGVNEDNSVVADEAEQDEVVIVKVKRKRKAKLEVNEGTYCIFLRVLYLY